MSTVAHESIVREAKRLKLKNIEYIDAAIRYFSLRGLNPVEVEAREGTIIIQQIKKLRDQLFAYMQEEERSVLMPMLEKLIKIRLTTERVLRLQEVLLSTKSEEELKGIKEKVEQLRNQNEMAIQAQVKKVVREAKEYAPGKTRQKSSSI
ncbi:BfmA/BtgA family mobilization protein [Rufibacter tibetensis]|nr:BfmA/BtgA family mobilization protein [Rufibacter tibetensis]